MAYCDAFCDELEQSPSTTDVADVGEDEISCEQEIINPSAMTTKQENLLEDTSIIASENHSLDEATDQLAIPPETKAKTGNQLTDTYYFYQGNKRKTLAWLILQTAPLDTLVNWRECFF